MLKKCDLLPFVKSPVGVTFSNIFTRRRRFTGALTREFAAWPRERAARRAHYCKAAITWVPCGAHGLSHSLTNDSPDVNHTLIKHPTHWEHDVVATLNLRHWRWFNVATTSFNAGPKVRNVGPKLNQRWFHRWGRLHSKRDLVLWLYCLAKQTAVTAYLSSKLLLLVVFPLQYGSIAFAWSSLWYLQENRLSRFSHFDAVEAVWLGQCHSLLCNQRLTLLRKWLILHYFF